MRASSNSRGRSVSWWMTTSARPRAPHAVTARASNTSSDGGRDPCPLELACRSARARGAGDRHARRAEAAAPAAGPMAPAAPARNTLIARMLHGRAVSRRSRRVDVEAAPAPPKFLRPQRARASPLISSAQRCCSRASAASSSRSRPITTPIPRRIRSAAGPSATAVMFGPPRLRLRLPLLRHPLVPQLRRASRRAAPAPC